MNDASMKQIGVDITDFLSDCNDCHGFIIFDMLNDPLLLLDDQGMVLFMNDKARKFYGHSATEAKKLHIADLDLNITASSKHLHTIRHAGDNGHIFLSTHQKKDSELTPVQIHARYINLHGKSLFALVIKDISPELKLKQEFKLASRAQKNMLPADYKGPLVEIRSIYQPNNYVSGDFFNFTWVNNHVVAGYLLDIMGHGMSTALTISALRVLLSQTFKQKLPLTKQLAWFNREAIPFFVEDSFTAMICFSFDFEKHLLTYSMAGINYFLAITEGQPRVIKQPGSFVGLDKRTEYEQHTLGFDSGDVFYFMSDGLFELLEAPEQLCPNNSAESFRWLCEAAQSRSRRDDISALCLHIK
ncbi:MAG: SpoIIE family protein phosphatase [Pelosinus sp.]|nr:SpoIIE family protein phosphatase [Pelosinus sp.]